MQQDGHSADRRQRASTALRPALPCGTKISPGALATIGNRVAMVFQAFEDGSAAGLDILAQIGRVGSAGLVQRFARAERFPCGGLGRRGRLAGGRRRRLTWRGLRRRGRRDDEESSDKRGNFRHGSASFVTGTEGAGRLFTRNGANPYAAGHPRRAGAFELAPTFHVRQVSKAVLREHMGLGSRALEATVFPESGGAWDLSARRRLSNFP